MTSGNRWVGAAAIAAILGAAPGAYAQSGEGNWNIDAAIGWDNSISGNINSGAVGTINDEVVVILRNRYEDVFGTGLNLRVGGGYEINDMTELRATFTFQSLDADLTHMGDFGASNLYAQYSDYQSLTLEVGGRRYGRLENNALRPYVEGLIGIGFIDKIDVQLIAPQAGLIMNATDFYDQTAAFTFSANVGVVWDASESVGLYTQIGIRYLTGMADVDQFVGTSLDTINNNSARWTMPFLVGVRFGF